MLGQNYFQPPHVMSRLKHWWQYIQIVKMRMDLHNVVRVYLEKGYINKTKYQRIKKNGLPQISAVRNVIFENVTATRRHRPAEDEQVRIIDALYNNQKPAFMKYLAYRQLLESRRYTNNSRLKTILLDMMGKRDWIIHKAWKSETAKSVALGIMKEQAFDRMHILADALEDAGCDNNELLNYLRGIQIDPGKWRIRGSYDLNGDPTWYTHDLLPPIYTRGSYVLNAILGGGNKCLQ